MKPRIHDTSVFKFIADATHSLAHLPPSPRRPTQRRISLPLSLSHSAPSFESPLAHLPFFVSAVVPVRVCEHPRGPGVSPEQAIVDAGPLASLLDNQGKEDRAAMGVSAADGGGATRSRRLMRSPLSPSVLCRRRRRRGRFSRSTGIIHVNPLLPTTAATWNPTASHPQPEKVRRDLQGAHGASTSQR